MLCASAIGEHKTASVRVSESSQDGGEVHGKLQFRRKILKMVLFSANEVQSRGLLADKDVVGVAEVQSKTKGSGGWGL